MGLRAYFEGKGRAAMGASLLGGLCALTQAPVYFTLLIFVVFPELFLLQSGKALRARALLGFWFGLTYFVGTLYWIAVAFHVDISSFWWLTPFTVLGLPAFLSLLFIATPLWIYGFVVERCLDRRESYFLFAAFLAAGEWLRGHILSGFPWALWGYTWSNSDAFSQLFSLTGAYGMTLLTLLLAGVELVIIQRRTMVLRVITLGVACILCVGAYWWGAHRVDHTPVSYVPNVGLRLVQPCISQSVKWEASQRRAIFERLEAMSRLDLDKSVTHIVWPESALPFFALESEGALHRMAALVPSQGGAVLSGAPRRAPVGALSQLWTSLLAVGASGHVEGVYDKKHLVPFGEYVPGRALLPSFVKKVTAGTMDYSPGEGPRLMTLASLPAFAPLICYEVIFPGAVVEKGTRPDWMLNITNDAWYGRTSGPFQHFDMARMRAVEEGLPLVRVANNGVSAVIDPLGRTEVRLELDEEGVLDAHLPRSLPPTLYARVGDGVFAFLLLGSMLLGMVMPRIQRKRNHP